MLGNQIDIRDNRSSVICFALDNDLNIKIGIVITNQDQLNKSI